MKKIITQNTTLNTQLMKQIVQYNKQVHIYIILALLLGCFSSYGQIFNPASVPFQEVPESTFRMNGELQMIGNTIVAPSRLNDNSPRDPNANYNGTLENGQFNAYGYIDVDVDASTFSSSSADFQRFSICGEIRYAGLYWSATYIDMDNLVSNGSQGLIANYNNPTQPDPRPAFDVIKFKPPNTPTGQYIDVTADRILYDGYPGAVNNPNAVPNNRPNNAVVDMPYHCYADVTDIVLTSTNPDGTYFVADQRASVGVIETNTDGGFNTSDFGGGWTLVIVYEDPSLPSQFISTNQGLGAVSGSTGDVNIQYNGFLTLPPNLPVNARYGIGAYEGDRPFDDDIISIEPTTTTVVPGDVRTVPPVSTDLDDRIGGRPNLVNNFFDSSISVDGVITTNRNPASTNTLGYDIDIFDIQRDNNTNPFLTNNQTEVNFRLRSSGDKYQVFVQAFQVEIIEPQVLMTKRVLRADASQPTGFLDITDGDVNFNEEVFYNLTIENTGNEDVTNVTIVDVLPDNVDFEDFDLISPGITQMFTPPTFNPDGSVNTRGTVTLTIDDSAITEGSPALTFRFRVRVVPDCASLRDACSNEIENIATSEYTGVISDITEGSVSIVERDICNFNVVGASTFLVRDDICFNEAEVQRLCRGTVTLRGGNGFTTYEWVNEANPTVVLSTDQEFDATAPGFYIVTTTSVDCRGTQRRFEVLPETELDNPIVDIVTNLDTNPNANGQVLTCSITGQPLPEIFLCGSSTTLDLDSTLGDTTVWQRLAPGACPTGDRVIGCPTVDPVCEPEWVTVGMGRVFTLDPGNTSVNPMGDASGEYRILTTVDGDCPTELFFNVFQSNFDPVIDRIRNIICGAPGALEVTNISSQFEYQLVRIENGNSIPEGGFQTTALFDNITTPGSYRVDAREINAPVEACIFPSNAITINNIDPTIEFNITDQPACATGDVNNTGAIEVVITGGEPTYRYEITGPAGFTPRTITGSSNPTADFDNLPPGEYTLTAYADDDNSATNCFAEEMREILEGNPFTVSVTPTVALVCNPDFNPTPVPPPIDVSPFDDDEYIAIVEVTITSTPVSNSYQFSTNPDFTQTGDYIFPFEVVGNVYRFRFVVGDEGTFPIYVRDNAPGAGCVTQGGTTITPRVEIAATATTVDPPCSNEQGSITVTVTAGTAPFTFLIDGTTTVPATTPGTGNGLGAYTFANIDPTTNPVVTVQNGGLSCDQELAPLNFNVPDAIDVTFGAITPLSCNADPNASIVVTDITGGSGTYEYSLDGGAFIAAPARPFTISNVVGQGTHSVTVRNVVTPPTPNCELTETFEIDPLLEVERVIVTPDDVDCVNQTTDVTLSADPTALPAGVTYEFRVTPNPATGAGNTGFVATTAYTFENTTSYTVEARRTDSNCIEETIFTPPNVPVARIIDERQTSPVSCNGGNDGAFTFSVSNGSITNPVTSFNYTVTGPGATNITVTNTTTNPVVITGSVATPIIAGTYTISITDTSLGNGSTGCTDTATVEVTQPDPITFTPSVTDQDCVTNLNEVSVSNVSGGNGPVYTFQVSHPTTGTFGPVPVTDVIDNIPNIPAGDPITTYTVTVFDVTGVSCSETVDLLITPLTQLEAAIDENSDVCLSGDNMVSFIVNIDPNGTGNTGTPDYRYTVSRGGSLVQTSTLVAGAVTSFTTNTFSQAGDYEIAIFDENDCPTTINITVDPLLTIVARRINDLSCDPTTGANIDGSFELTIAGGSANYDITFENTTTSTTGNVALGVTTTAAVIPFSSDEAGNFVFTVTDRAGLTVRCTATDTGELTDRSTPTITSPDVDVNCDGDQATVTITVTGPETEYFVQFDDNDATTTDVFVQTVSNQIQVPNLSEGVYNFIVRDSRGCSFPETVSVIAPDPIQQQGAPRITPITCDELGTPSTVLGALGIDILDRGPLTYTYTLVLEANVSVRPLVPAPTSSPNPQTILSNSVDFSGLDAGRYYIFIEDQNGCAERLGPFAVASDVDDLTVITTVIATCPDLVTLNVEIDPTEGVGPFLIEVIGLRPQVPTNGLPTSSILPTDPPGTQERNHQFTLLPFNTVFEVRVEDTNTMCVFTRFVDPVDPPAEPALIDISEIPVSCNDGTLPLPTDGEYRFTIDVSSLGTAPPVTQVSWAVFESGTNNPAAGTNTTGISAVGAADIPIVVSDLAPGLYYVIVQEDDGTLCPARADFEIEIPDPLVSVANNPRVAECDDEVRFSITTNGGTPIGGSITPDEGYRYSRVRRGDPVGLFTDDVTTINQPFTIDPTMAIDLQWDIYTRDDNNCISGPLQIDIDVTAGPSIINVGDVMNPCDLSDYILTIETSADPLALNSNGNIFYGFDDGINPVVFEEAPPGSYTYTFPIPGTYELIVRDNNGCEETPRPSVTVFPQAEIIAEFTTPPDCTSIPPLGVIETTLDPDGLGLIGSGAANHTYTLIDVATGLPAVGIINVGGGRFEQVPAGSYIVRLEDSGMGAVTCPFETPVAIQAPIQPDIDNTMGVTDASCNTATPAPAPNTGTGDGRIEVSLNGGLDPNATYQYEITGSLALGVTRPLQNSNIFNNLAPDTYTIRVVATLANGPSTTDDVVCEDTKDYIVGEAPAIVATPEVVPAFSCNATDGSEEFPIITIDVSGGTLTAGDNYRVSYTRPAPLTPVVDEEVVDALPAAGIQFQTTATVAGTYDFIFKDSNNCEVAAQVIVPPFVRISNELITVTAPGITCVTSEEVTVTIEGGTGPFTFAEITGSGLADQTGIALGTGDLATTPQTETGVVFTLPNAADETRTYRFRVTDTNTGCFLEVDHDVERVDNLEVVGRQLSPETCFEEADGQIEITVSGYTFDDDTTVTVGGDLTYTIIDNATGVEVVDGGGAAIPGSNGPLTMTTDPQTFTLPFGASQGNYTINIVQVGNPQCEEPSNPIPILGPAELELILPPFVTTTCSLDDGEFTATTNGARGTVTYEIVETGATSANGTFTDLAPTDANTPRVYTVIATDTFTLNGMMESCTDTETIEVRPPVDDLNIDTITPVGVTCNGDADGSITITVSGTNMPFRYTITPVVTGVESDRQDSNVFNLLAPGDYIINVYDSVGCFRDTTPPVTVPEPEIIEIEVDNVTETTCNVTTADVRLVVTAPSFTAPYTVEARDVTLRDEISTPSNPISEADRDRLVGQQTTDASGVVTFTGLPEGIYEFFAISGTCTSDRAPAITIDVPDQVMAVLDLDNINIVCFGEMTASVDLNSIMGGLGNYMYSLDVTPIDGSPAFTLGPQGDPFFNTLGAGNYVYRIESVPGSGCEFSEPFQITQPAMPFEAVATPTNITCSGETDGMITVTASGGNTNNPYRFSLFNSAGERIFEFVSDEEDNTPGVHVFEELAEDLTGYTVIAEDGEGCRFVVEPIIIEEPDPIIIDLIDSTNETCAGDNDGTATVSIMGGTANPDPALPTYTWSVDGSPFMPVTDPTNLVITDLPGRSIELIIRDFNECDSPRIIEIGPGVVLSADLINELECPVWDYSNPEVPVMIQGPEYSIFFQLNPESVNTDIEYMLTGINGTADPIPAINTTGQFIVLPGEYEGSMMHVDGCVEVVGTIVVEEYMSLTTPVAVMTNNPQDPNEYEITVTGGSGDYTYSIAILPDGLTGTELANALLQLTESDYRELDSNIFSIEETANYVIRVIDNLGCEVLGVQNLTFINILIPNFFTPDGDGTNDFWYPRQDSPNPGSDPFFFTDMEVKVFDRYGRLLEEFRGDQQGWDGIYQGKELPSGDYWFTIILNDKDNREFTGHFTLYR